MVNIVTDLHAIPDGKTDSTAILQAALNARGEVVIPAGGCIVSRPLTIYGNTRLIIDGMLQLASNSNSSLITVASGAYLFRIEGTGQLDGNRAQQSALGPPNGPFSTSILCTSGFPFSTAGGQLAGLFNIEGLYITNFFHWAMSLGNCAGFRVRDIKADSCGNSFQFTAGASDGLAEGLRISNITDDGFAFYGGCSVCSIVDSTIVACQADGITILMDTGSSSPCSAISVRNNKVLSCNAGITARQLLNVQQNGYHDLLLIEGNHVWSHATQGVAFAWGANSLIRGNILGPSNKGGNLSISPNLPNIVVDNNVLN